MSIMCCIYVPEGIVMAADSRITRTKPTKTVDLPDTGENTKHILHVQTTYTLSDNAQKVLLIKKVGVGVSFCGNALIDGMTVADSVRKFEIEKVDEQDSVAVVAQKLADCYAGKGTHFFVSGYNDDVPYVYDVNGSTVERLNIIVGTSASHDPRDAASDAAVPETGIPQNVREISEPVPVAQAPIVRCGANWAGQMTAITKIVNNAPILNADWDTMPLKDAIDFAEFLVDTTIKYERFCDDIQTCGGDIDILVITKDESFWKQHKIYNPLPNK